MEGSWRPAGIDLAVGLLVSGLAFTAAFGAPGVGVVLGLPGLATALLIQLAARTLGAGLGPFDGDEVPGPVAMWIGIAVNVLTWTMISRAGRALIAALRR